MDQKHLEALLSRFKSGEIELEQAMESLRHLPFESLGYATVDHHRAIRQGFPEVIFGQGKTPEHVAGIAEKLLERASNLLVTRTNREAFEQVKRVAADAVFHNSCNAIAVHRDKTVQGRGTIAVVTAGTSDIPVADEAALGPAYDAMARRLGPRVVVARMAPAGAELVVGLTRDPTFGPIIGVGSGGTLVELTRDMRWVLPPIDAGAARRLIDRLACRRLLGGFRGHPAADLDRARIGVVQAGHQPQQRGLAAAARTHQRHQLASVDGELGIDHRRQHLAGGMQREGLGESGDVQDHRAAETSCWV